VKLRKTNKNVRDQIDDIRSAPVRDCPPHAKRQRIAALVIDTMESEGSFFFTGHEFLYFQKHTAKLFALDRDSIHLSAMILVSCPINKWQ
jgi:hypothetical protein